MRNMSYMGRVVVKLVIIAIIAFVVITTAVFIINKNKSEGQVTELPGGTAIVKQEDKKATEKENKVAESTGSATSSNDKSTNNNSSNNSAINKSSGGQSAASELPKTGPTDVLVAAFAVALVSFSGVAYLNSRKAF